jgi:hypothetical protein
LALVETSGERKARHSAAAPAWAVTRTASVSCLPRSQRPQRFPAGISQVFGPASRADGAPLGFAMAYSRATGARRHHISPCFAGP